MSTAIEFNHVSKLYQLGVVGTGTLSNDIKRWWATSILGKEDPFLKVGQTNDRSAKANSDFVYALRDIDFKVEQGDVVGIIGKNGAGKSTLLKLLSRITAPTTGTIRARGRIASLLEVGTGFHGELTGRENIYMNGAIMGMTKQEIDRKLDEIIDFSGCEMYIDTPVKRYSSGMSVRLGFAVAAFLEPEILVVDEVLAVGDAEFQKKAIGKMQDVSTGEGRTVLFVSHNMGSVRRLCHRGILLSNGTVEMEGAIDDVVYNYLKENSESSGDGVFEVKSNDINKISSIRFYNSKNSETTVICTGESLRIEVECQGVDFLDPLIGLGIYFKNRYQERIAGITTYYGEVKRNNFIRKEHSCCYELSLDSLPLTPGIYTVMVALAKKNVKVLDIQENAISITVIQTIDNVTSSFGSVFLSGKWLIK